MAIHHLTPPVRGGERPRLPSTHRSKAERGSGGPVTQAIRAMRVAEPVTKNDTVSSLLSTKTETVSVFAGRQASQKLSVKSETVSHSPATEAAIAAIREGVMRFLAERIQRDIALLDALDGDCDLEDGHDAEGLTDDNGLGDYDALSEQGFPGYGRCA